MQQEDDEKKGSTAEQASLNSMIQQQTEVAPNIGQELVTSGIQIRKQLHDIVADRIKSLRNITAGGRRRTQLETIRILTQQCVDNVDGRAEELLHRTDRFKVRACVPPLRCALPCAQMHKPVGSPPTMES